jgi:hypothetical protein
MLDVVSIQRVTAGNDRCDGLEPYTIMVEEMGEEFDPIAGSRGIKL